jgi:hypothetical protein
LAPDRAATFGGLGFDPRTIDIGYGRDDVVVKVAVLVVGDDEQRPLPERSVGTERVLP